MKFYSNLVINRLLPGCLYLLCVFGGASVFAQNTAVEKESDLSAAGKLLKSIEQIAQQRAKKDFVSSSVNVPDELRNISIRQYRAIGFNPEAAIWRGSEQYEVQLFHPGFLYVHPIKLNLIDQSGQTDVVPFDQDDFLYDDSIRSLKQALASEVSKNLGFAGFRVHYPINQLGYKDEMLVFQGASYFRPVGPGQIYGLSARGLAIDTGQPSGEEFPRFVEYWLQEPKPGENTLVIGALLDSPSVTGAYVFTINVTTRTILDVNSTLYTRRDIAKLGIAPLTSMFFFGENSRRALNDFRPEVHDSDGLQIFSAAGEWIWRPIQNPKNLTITSSVMSGVQGFGLAQRDRQFEHYLDTHGRYHVRPSLWVEPKNDWGAGRVELVEIPTNNETNDNIVAYWVSNKPVKAGTVLKYDYRLTTFDDQVQAHSLAQVERTHIGSVRTSGQNSLPDGARRFVVDFTGGDIQKLDASMPVIADLHVNGGIYQSLTVSKISEADLWRVSFVLVPEGKSVVDMRMSIQLRGQKLSEVWNYVWTS